MTWGNIERGEGVTGSNRSTAPDPSPTMRMERLLEFWSTRSATSRWYLRTSVGTNSIETMT